MRRLYISDDKTIMVIYDDNHNKATPLKFVGEYFADGSEPKKVVKGLIDSLTDTNDEDEDDNEDSEDDEDVEPEEVETVPYMEKAKGVRACKSCGKPGHFAKTCPDAQVVPPPILPPQSFGERVQELKSEGMSSGEVAEELGCNVAKVNLFWIK